MVRERLVGRRSELAVIDEAIESAGDGARATLFVVGEPGIGKSHLLRVASDRARAAGFRVLTGRCWEAGGAPPGWPFREALRSLAETPELARACETLGPRRRYLGALVPELAGEGGFELRSEHDASARFASFDAATSLLVELARTTPTLLVLEDLHAADRHTIELLVMVANATASAPLMVMGSYRSREARLAGPVGDGLAAAGRVARILPLGPLDRDEAEELTRTALGEGASDLDVSTVLAASDGNPLFMLELARAAGSRTRGPVLAGLDHAIAAHLSVLSPTARAVAGVAAAFGRSVDLALLLRVARDVDAGDEPSIVAAVEELERAELFVTDEHGKLWFAHILVRDALYRAVEPLGRAAIHAAAVAQLEALGASATELGHHALAAVPALPAARAVELGRRAAREATSVAAFGDAAEVLTRVVAVADAAQGFDRATRLALHLDLAEAEVFAGRVSHGRDACARVSVAAEAAGHPELVARAALIYGAEFSRGTSDPRMVELLERALNALGEEPTPLRVRVLARYATARFPCVDPEIPVRLAEQAIAQARRLGDERTLLHVLYLTRLPLFFWHPSQELLELNAEFIELTRRHSADHELARNLMTGLLILVGSGEIAQFDSLLAEVAALAARNPTPQQVFRVHMLRSMAAVRRGNFAEAERWLVEAEQCTRRGPVEPPLPTFLLTRFGQARLRRDRDQLIELSQPIIAELATTPNGFAMCGWLHAFLGDLDATRAELARAADTDLRGRPPMIHALIGEAAIALGDRAMARRVYDHLTRFPGMVLAWGFIAFAAEGVVDGWLARLAAFLGDHEAAKRHFDRAVELDQQQGARPALVNLLEDWAEILADSREHRARAGEVFLRAARLLDELGLTERARHARQRASDLDADRSSVPAATPAHGDPHPALLELCCEGDTYRVELGGETIRVRASKGMRYLALLVARPGQEVHVMELIAADANSSVPRNDSDAGPMLDATAKDRYRTRLRELDAELAEAEACCDLGRIERSRAEREALVAELTRATGLGGRTRKAGSAVERARVNVQRRLRSALASVGKHSIKIASHLERALRTGTFCSYDPPVVP